MSKVDTILYDTYDDTENILDALMFHVEVGPMVITGVDVKPSAEVVTTVLSCPKRILVLLAIPGVYRENVHVLTIPVMSPKASCSLPANGRHVEKHPIRMRM